MYCPRCGEQQTSGNLRFCSRCGLPMGLVSEVLSNDGSLPQLEELYKNKGIFTRKNGVFFSICWFIFFVLLMTPFWAIVDVEEMAALSSIAGVFGSLLILLFSLFFLGKPKIPAFEQGQMQNPNAVPQNLTGSQPAQGALPPQQTQSAHEYASPAAGSWKAPTTGDLVQPGSVTEGTTKLLKKEEQAEE